MTTGLLLLSGGRGARLGRTKHDAPHPDGGSWGGHLVRVFQAVCPEGPVCVLGDPLPDWPALPRLEDPREGPAVALRHWCLVPAPPAARWWVVACDQVRWTPATLRAWLARTEAADPGAAQWVLGSRDGRLQPLGGVMAHALREDLAGTTATSLHQAARGVPHLILDVEGEEWSDVDTPEERRRFEAERRAVP